MDDRTRSYLQLRFVVGEIAKHAEALQCELDLMQTYPEYRGQNTVIKERTGPVAKSARAAADADLAKRGISAFGDASDESARSHVPSLMEILGGSAAGDAAAGSASATNAPASEKKEKRAMTAYNIASRLMRPMIEEELGEDHWRGVPIGGPPKWRGYFGKFVGRS